MTRASGESHEARDLPVEESEEVAEDSSRRQKAARTPTKEWPRRSGWGDDESVKHEQKRVPPSFLPPSDSEPKRRASSRGGDASRSAAADSTPREPISKKGRRSSHLRDL